jgi:DNA-binding IclR family transcriptional regulator
MPNLNDDEGRVLRYLQAMGDPRASVEIADALGLKLSRVGTLLVRLRITGHIRMNRRVTYQAIRTADEHEQNL